jgi:hypothetical protein
MLAQRDSERLEKALRTHRDLLRRHLADEGRFQNGIHGLVAVHLRVLLCDRAKSLVQLYADQKMANIYLFAPVQYPERLRKGMVTQWNHQVIGREPFVGSSPTNLDGFLHRTIFVVPVRAFQDARPGDDVTPFNLIRWVADKDAFAHLDFNLPAAFRSLKTWHRSEGLMVTDEACIKDGLFQIADWTADIVDQLLGAKPGTNIS